MNTSLYKPIEVEATGRSAIVNPFFADLEGRFTGPDGSVFRIPGYYAGENVWKVRFAPTLTGTWHYTLRSASIAGVDGQSGTVECASGTGEVHGCLRVSEEYKFHFVFEDGTPHFMNAYECDWLWALDLETGGLAKTTALVDSIVSHKFNTIITNVYAHDSGWTPGKTSEYDYGPPAAFPWAGTNEDPDHSEINTAFFDHYDRVVQLLADKGLMIHLFIKVYNKMVNWPVPYSPEEDMFFKYVVARYQAYWNITWDFSKESKNEPDKDYLLNRLNYIKSIDAYRHLVTTHDDPGYFTTEARRKSIDFFTAQQHTNYYYSALAGRERYRVPYFNSEFAYEHGPGGMDDYTYGVRQSPEEHISRAYEVVMDGAYPAYYYTHTARDVIDFRYDPPGCTYFEILYGFFTSLEWWKFEPTLEFSQPNSALCLARGNEEVVIYPGLRDRKRTDIFLTAPLDFTQYEGFWMDIFSGERVAIAVGTIVPNAKGLNHLTIPFDSGTAIVYLKRGTP